MINPDIPKADIPTNFVQREYMLSKIDMMTDKKPKSILRYSGAAE